jgi:hypothetical protein
MPKRLLLDGDDLPALMLRVRAEMGPGARIVKAERIRNGGFAGFFARERYELVVEVPDPPSARERWRQGRTGINALLDAADAAEGDDLEPAVEDVPQVSTSGDTFAQVLESMRDIVGGPGPVVAAHEGMPGAEPSTVEPPRDARTGAVPVEWPVVPRPAVPDAVPDPVSGVVPGVHPDLDTAPEPTSGSSSEAESEPAPAPVLGGSGEDGATVARLLELGVPVRLLEGFPSLTAPVPLSMLVRRFERPPSVRLEAGALIAVVGPGDEVLRTASQMAQRARLDPREVLLAGEIDSVAGHGRRLLTVSAASRCRSRLRDDCPTIVALGVGPATSAWVAAAVLLQALDPDQAWGVLDAGMRSGQMRRWLRTVGELRPVDAVAAVNTADAQAPGTVLDLGTPVGWVDGLPATPVVWAALLSERLVDDAHGD